MNAGLRLGRRSYCSTHGEHTPILTVAGSDNGISDYVSVTTADRTGLTPDDLVGARDLLAAVTAYATEVERMAAEQGVTAP